MANKRVVKNNNNPPGDIDNLVYNQASGAQKNMEVGRHLLPLGDGASGFTTDASTARILPNKGRCLAVYNNANAIGAVTLGEDNTVVALAAGIADVNGHVGIPCKANDWTFIACNDKQWVKATAATLIVLLIADETEIKT